MTLVSDKFQLHSLTVRRTSVYTVPLHGWVTPFCPVLLNPDMLTRQSVSCRQHAVGSCFITQPDDLWLLTEGFSPSPFMWYLICLDLNLPYSYLFSLLLFLFTFSSLSALFRLFLYNSLFLLSGFHLNYYCLSLACPSGLLTDVYLF